MVSCAVEEALNEYTCETSDVGYGDFETCCNTTDCYYLYNDKKYECDGQDCEDAATEMAKDMIANSKKSANIDECEIDVEELTNKILQRN